MVDITFPTGVLWLGDCLYLMRHIPDGSVDLVVTSPPYDDLRDYNGSNDWSFEKFKLVAQELKRIICNGGIIVWNVSDQTVKGSETGSSFRQALYFKNECSLNLHDTMIFSKPTRQAVGSQYSYWQSFEYMFVFSNGKPKTINLLKDIPNKYAGYKTTAGTRNKKGEQENLKPRVVAEFSKRNNVWEYLTGNNNGDDKVGHPAPFPVKLANDHIVSWSNSGDLILDPFAGSGTTAIAAHRSGRRFICIERDPEYYLRAGLRIASEYRS